jgi:putative glycerol-1-phosphate prenyltransferase
MKASIYEQILSKKSKGKKSLAILIDPDKINQKSCLNLIKLAEKNHLDFFFVGGSLISSGDLDLTIKFIKKHTNIPVIIFPGSNLQISSAADAILLLSLVSGRNPEFLISQQVVAAPMLKKSELEIISTAYMLINCGNQTTASYMSNTTPIPHDKADIAVCTALAAQMLGMKMVYMDGGSGAKETISESMVKKVSEQIDVPLLIGGGIKDTKTAQGLLSAGADILVIGTSIEQNPKLIGEFCQLVTNY